jgi:uncharacterized protein (UPF0548 family)
MEMLSFHKPSADALRLFLTAQAPLPFTYHAVGATATTPPAGYVVDRTRIQLGVGEPAFRSAVVALRRWQHFRLGWAEPWPPETPIERGTAVAVLVQVLGLWWLNACRVVYVVDEAGPVPRFGFAYGTLPCHAESGEERFQIEWDQGDNVVWYDILAYSRPNGWLTRLGYPFVRRVQKRFARDSAAAMLRAVQAAHGIEA